MNNRSIIQVFAEKVAGVSGLEPFKSIIPTASGFGIFVTDKSFLAKVMETAGYPEEGEKFVAEISGEAKPYYGHTSALTDISMKFLSYVKGMSEVDRSLTYALGVSKPFTSYGAVMGEIIKNNTELIADLARAPEELFTLGKIPFETPRSLPTVRLHEIIPLLASIEASRPKGARSPTIERVSSAERPRPIEIKVESPENEYDLRDLRTKIARIIREEARRYGVY